MPRKSSAALAFANPAPSFATIAPPADMDGLELETFRQVVNAVDPGHFEPSDLPLLQAFCSASALQQRSGKTLKANPRDADALTAFSTATRLLVLLSAKLKLSPMSRRHNYRKPAKLQSVYDAMEEDA